MVLWYHTIMTIHTNTKKNKKEVFFIATRYQNRPMRVSFYMKKTGEVVPSEAVKRERTKEGLRFYTMAVQ